MVRVNLFSHRRSLRFPTIVCLIFLNSIVWPCIHSYVIQSGDSANSSNIGSAEAPNDAPNQDSQLPTLYEYYTSGGIQSGLEAEGDVFVLNGKPIRIISGSMHYFRIPPESWSITLLKMKAAGLNAVDVYVPWNLHEEHPGQYNFSGILDLKRFLQLIKEADLFVIFRPGPYICAEFEFGGLPGWLLRDPDMKIRSIYPGFKEAQQRYITRLLPEVLDHQFTKTGGPIIMVQVDNEFGNFGDALENPSDLEYLRWSKQLMSDLGVKELFFTSDTPTIGGKKGAIPGVLMTANFKDNPEHELKTLKKLQPNKPMLVSEYWTGWFDFWRQNFHQTMSIDQFINTLRVILEMGASVNFYMFIGGTNFGFLNGANIDPTPYGVNGPFVTSYDYDAPLSEPGDTTAKYDALRTLLHELCATLPDCPKVRIPPVPSNSMKKAYGKVSVTQSLSWDSILDKSNPLVTQDPVPMEMLEIGQNYGQNFGFTVYRAKIPKSESLTLSGPVADRALIMIDGVQVAALDWTGGSNQSVPLNGSHFSAVKDLYQLEIVVENMGRINFGNPALLNSQRKGLLGPVLLDNASPVKGWQVFPLEFKQEMLTALRSSSNWLPLSQPHQQQQQRQPTLYRLELQLDENEDSRQDTFLYLPDSWQKGIVILNDFNLGRYWNVGPQRTLFVPRPVLRSGVNEILVFELHSSGTEIEFLDTPILGPSPSE